MRSGKTPLHDLWKAFDEAQFSAADTLNLRESLPTVADARYRTEQWLRERQVSRAKQVLIITGRGNNSPDSVSPVRTGVHSLFPSLRRRGIIAEWREHTPGAFVISLAPISALLNAPKRRRDRDHAAASHTPRSIEGLDRRTIDLLRRLATRSLEALGAKVPDKFLEAEMVSRFNSLAAGIPPGPDAEERLRGAISAALEQLDE
jgi:hypothetical protein